jgi:hypothetical protein
VHSGITRLKNCDENLKQDRMFMEKYRLLSTKFIEKFTKEKIENEH